MRPPALAKGSSDEFQELHGNPGLPQSESSFHPVKSSVGPARGRENAREGKTRETLRNLSIALNTQAVNGPFGIRQHPDLPPPIHLSHALLPLHGLHAVLKPVQGLAPAFLLMSLSEAIEAVPLSDGLVHHRPDELLGGTGNHRAEVERTDKADVGLSSWGSANNRRKNADDLTESRLHTLLRMGKSALWQKQYAAQLAASL